MDIKEYYSNNRIEVTHGHLTVPRDINYHIAKFKKSDVDFIDVTGQGFLGRGSYYFDSRTTKYGRPPDLIKQMDEGDYSAKIVKGLGISDCLIYKSVSSETCVQWDKDSNILGISNKIIPGCCNAVGGSNWLVDRGEIHWSVLDEPPEYAPRSAIGWDDIYYYWVIIDGRNDGTLGVSKPELAQFFIGIPGVNKLQLMAHNNDGGDSNQMAVNVDGEMRILNNLVEGYEHSLIQYAGVWLKEAVEPLPEPPPETQKLLAFTLADDLLPPVTLHNFTDEELKQHPELWPFDVFRKPRKDDNIPATCTTYKKGSFTQSIAWLIYWANNCALAWFNVYDYNELRNTQYWDEFEKAWLSLTKGTRVVTNGKGHDNGYYDPVSGENLGKEPMGIDALLMERNVVELTGTHLEKYGGILGFLFRCFDGSVQPPDIHSINYKTHPWLFSKANILLGKDYTGNSLQIDPFSQGWQFGGHTPFPNVCMPDKLLPGGINLVPENRVHLTDGEVTIIDYIPNAYNPERYLNMSLQEYIDSTPSGGIVTIPSGEYGSAQIIKPIRLIAEPGATLVGDGGNGISVVNKRDVVIQGFAFHGWNNAIYISGLDGTSYSESGASSNVIIRDNTILADRGRGVFIQTSDHIIVRDNKITTPTQAPYQTDCIYSQRNYKNIYHDNELIIHNQDPNGHDDCIQMYQDTDMLVYGNYLEQDNDKITNAQGLYATTMYGVSKFYNNVINLGNAQSNALAFRRLDGTGTVEIVNNTIYGIRPYHGIWVTDTPNAVVKNNISYLLSGDAINVSGGDVSNNFTDNPRFVDIESNDFHLQSDSPVIGKGTVLASPYDYDKDGIARDSSWDIGAYEYMNETIPQPKCVLVTWDKSMVSEGAEGLNLREAPTMYNDNTPNSSRPSGFLYKNMKFLPLQIVINTEGKWAEFAPGWWIAMELGDRVYAIDVGC